MRKRILIATIVVFTNLFGFAQTPTLFVPDSIFGLGSSTVAGKIGVGTSNPAEKLDVFGNITLSGANRTISSGTGYSLGFKIGSTQHMILSNGGNFSIGTTSATQKLTVAGNMYLYGSNRDIMVGSGYSLSFKNGTTQQNMIITSAGKVGIGTTTPTEAFEVMGNIMLRGGHRSIGTDTDQSLSFTVDGVQRMTINGDGYVGIGTTAPAEALDVNGNINLSGVNRSFGTSSNNSLNFKTYNTNRLTISADGKVGIGTTSPLTPLHVNGAIYTNAQLTARTLYISGVNNKSTIDAGDASLNFQTDGTDHMTITVDGKVGIGTATPNAKFEIGVSHNYNQDEEMRIGSNYNNSFYGIGLNYRIDEAGTPSNHIVSYNGGVKYTAISILENNVGIGTNPHPDYKLAVNGKIIATEIVVKEYGNWPDYVFANSYNLRSLGEVENFINENGHLPEVPSAKVVEETGVGVGEMNAVLLKKVEELTLYAIQQGKLIKALEEKLEKMEAAK